MSGCGTANTGEVLWINASANVFVFGGFNIHHKDCLTYSSGTDRPGDRPGELL